MEIGTFGHLGEKDAQLQVVFSGDIEGLKGSLLAACRRGLWSNRVGCKGGEKAEEECRDETLHATQHRGFPSNFRMNKDSAKGKLAVWSGVAILKMRLRCQFPAGDVLP
jgi:hypothetical protein